jgi:molybdopterin converting factor small subunit
VNVKHANITIRYFAGARAAAGTELEQLSLEPGTTVADLKAVLAQRHGSGLVRVLAVASLLVDEVAADPGTSLRDGAQVDVLPPFAGG